MLARKTKIDAKALADPDAAVWSDADSASVDLVPTPRALQPSPYLAQTERDRPVGRVKQVRVRSLHNGSEIAFRLEWEDSARDDAVADNDAFPDGAALLFPLQKDAPLMTMGAEGKPVAAWHWRADRPAHARSNVAQGLGSTRVVDEGSVATTASWRDGRWRLVFRRPLRVSGAENEVVQIETGDTLLVGFAVWEGGNGERGGLKSFSPGWHPVTLEN